MDLKSQGKVRFLSYVSYSLDVICCTVSDIEGTLELSELYSYVDAINTEDEPKPVIDDSPSKDDVKFMKMAHIVSLNSPDKSTKV